MTNIIEQMEHPMVAEMRRQMEEEKAAFEQQLLEKDEIIADKDSQLEEANWVYDRNFDRISDMFKVKNADGKTEQVKLTVDELINKLHGCYLFDKCDTVYNPKDTLIGILENLKPDTETIIKKEVEYVKVIPNDVKSAVENLNKIINNH